MSKKKLTFLSIVLLTINSIIGTGIFLSPGSVTVLAGDKAPLLYLVASILAIVLAITFASAAKYVKKGGAAYAYAKAAFGDNIGFYVGITRFVASCIAWGVMATGTVKTALSIYGADSTDFQLITIGFILLMLIMLLINLSGIRIVTFLNNLSTIGKVAALVTFILCGGVFVVLTGENHFSDVMELTTNTGAPLIPPMDISLFVTATLAAFYAFTGFESVATGSEDMENPEKDLPRALPIAILIIAFLYIGIVVIAMLLNSKVLVETKEVVVLASLFQNGILRNIILYGALISMFGINVAASFCTPRILESLAEEKQAPKIFTYRTNLQCPLYATILTILFAIALPLSFQYDMTNIIVLSSLSRFIQFIVVPLAVLSFYYRRHKEKIIESASKNFITDVIIPILAFCFSFFLIVKFDWVSHFCLLSPQGEQIINIGAITAVIISYIVLPLLLFIWKLNKEKVEDKKIAS
ncbi:MAG: APC family permease [Erysipelotrichaceae bacterium]|nr:APC family permease [Erysipelotrichaceae bacterium]